MIFTHCSQFHTLANRVLFSILMLRLSLPKIAFTFRFFCVSAVLQETFLQNLMQTKLFAWFINLLRPSIFGYQEENSIITTIQSVTIQTYSIDENALRKNLYLLRYSLPHYCALHCAAFIHHLQSHYTTSGFYFQYLKGYLAWWKHFLSFRKC